MKGFSYMTYYEINIFGAIKAALLLCLLPLLNGCGSEASSAETPSTKDIISENMDSYQIVIPGISQEYDLLFLTDTHVTIPSNSDTSKEHKYTTERLNLFTAESGHIGSALFTAWIEYANETKIDGLLLGGDIIDCPTAANIQYLQDSLNTLQIPYLYTPGNHDWTFPWEYMTETGTAQYLSKLSPFMENNTAIHSLEYDVFIIVAIDNSSNQIHPAALEEYKNILAQGKPVIVMLHVPLYTEELFAKTSPVWGGHVILGGGIHGGTYPNPVSAQFLSLTTAADSPVAAVLAGHVHMADCSTVSSKPQIIQITGDAGYKGKSILLHITGDKKEATH